MVLVSCSKKFSYKGTYYNNKDKITINKNNVILEFGDTVFDFKLDTQRAYSKFIFLRPIEDTLKNLGLNIKKSKSSISLDSTLIIFDKSITACQCYCIKYGAVFFQSITEKDIKIPKVNSFYIFTNFKYPLKKYRLSDEILIEDNTIYTISTLEKQYYPRYYYYLSWGLEPISRNKIRYLDKIYKKQ